MNYDRDTAIGAYNKALAFARKGGAEAYKNVQIAITLIKNYKLYPCGPHNEASIMHLAAMYGDVDNLRELADLYPELIDYPLERQRKDSAETITSYPVDAACTMQNCTTFVEKLLFFVEYSMHFGDRHIRYAVSHMKANSHMSAVYRDLFARIYAKDMRLEQRTINYIAEYLESYKECHCATQVQLKKLIAPPKTQEEKIDALYMEIAEGLYLEESDSSDSSDSSDF